MIRDAAALAVVLIALLPTVPQPQSAAAEQGVISGSFTDAAGCPVPDATLRVRPIARPWDGPVLSETRADSQGRFAFTPINSGTYWVQYEVQNSPYGSVSGGDLVRLTAAGAAVAFTLRGPPHFAEFELRVLVTDRDESPIRGARVSWHRLVGKEESTCVAGALFTGADGWGGQRSVSPGLYRIRVEADGFAPHSRDERVGWGLGPYSVRLRTWAEEEKAKKPERVMTCCGPSPPSSIAALVSLSHSIVVARVLRAALDPVYQDHGPSVRTRYEIEPVEVIKPHPKLAEMGARVRILHWAGEMEWEDAIVVGCEGTTLKEQNVYIFFLKWDDTLSTFYLWHGNELVANVTTGVVTPMRRVNHVAPVIAERNGMPVEAFLKEIRSAAVPRP